MTDTPNITPKIVIPTGKITLRLAVNTSVKPDTADESITPAVAKYRLLTIIVTPFQRFFYVCI